MSNFKADNIMKNKTQKQPTASGRSEDIGDFISSRLNKDNLFNLKFLAFTSAALIISEVVAKFLFPTITTTIAFSILLIAVIVAVRKNPVEHSKNLNDPDKKEFKSKLRKQLLPESMILYNMPYGIFSSIWISLFLNIQYVFFAENWGAWTLSTCISISILAFVIVSIIQNLPVTCYFQPSCWQYVKWEIDTSTYTSDPDDIMHDSPHEASTSIQNLTYSPSNSWSSCNIHNHRHR